LSSFELLAAPSDDIKALVEHGKSADAYAEAKKHPDQFGDPAFDFYYGIAAIDTGNSGEGVLALERYLLNFPDNVSARLQLARGYFVLGEDARAREEFEALRRLNPPTDVGATIDRFLDAIRLRETRYNPSAGGYIELGLGYDSNINSGVANSNIFLGNLGPVVITQTGQKINSGFASVGGGGYLSYPVAPGVALFGSAAGEQKFDFASNSSQFQLGNFDVAGGVSLLREKNLYKLSLVEGVITLGDRTYRTATGAGLEWRYQLDELQTFYVGGQYANLRYNDPNGPMDASLWGISTGYRRQFSYPWEPAITVGVNYAEQHSSQGRPDLVPRTSGANVGVSFTPAAKWGVAMGYTYLKSDYEGINILAGVARKDTYQAFNGVVSYLINRNMSVRAEANLAHNSSNIDLYAFPRDVFMMKLRYDFK
jgi:tetratricopeptide (TPR) repeat protein